MLTWKRVNFPKAAHLLSENLRIDGPITALAKCIDNRSAWPR
jgi:hypothetical protein